MAGSILRCGRSKTVLFVRLLPSGCGWSCCVPLQKAATDPAPSVSVSAGREDGGEDETSQPSADPAVHHAVQESESGLKEGLRYLSFTQ